MTSSGAPKLRAPAIPTCRSAAARCPARAVAVRAAASTGPTPQTIVVAPSAPRSSAGVAATTRITAPPYPACRLERCADGRPSTAVDGGPKQSTNRTGMASQGISVSVEKDRATVQLAGEHEAYTADKLAKHISALLDEGVPMTIDLRQAAFIDSSVVGVLLAANRRA